GSKTYLFLAAGAGVGLAAAPPFLALAGAGPATASFASCRAKRHLRRAELFGRRTPLAAARSSARSASTTVAARSDSSPEVSPNQRRALTIRVLTSERVPRFRVARRAPARACFFAEAVRLATREPQEGVQTHEDRI